MNYKFYKVCHFDNIFTKFAMFNYNITMLIINLIIMFGNIFTKFVIFNYKYYNIDYKFN